MTKERKVLRRVSEGYWLGEFDNFRKTGTRVGKCAESFCGEYLKGIGLGSLITLENVGSGLTNERQVLRGVSEGTGLGNLRILEKLERGLTNERKVLRGVSEGY
jgi:hypothetical protein